MKVLGIACALSLAAVACGVGVGDARPRAGPRRPHSGEPSGDTAPVLLQRRLRPRLHGDLLRAVPRHRAGDRRVRIATTRRSRSSWPGSRPTSSTPASTRPPSRWCNRGLYQPLDVDRLEHWDDIFPSMKELPGRRGRRADLHRARSTPARRASCTTPTTSPTPPDSWTDLFDPQYAGARLARGPRRSRRSTSARSRTGSPTRSRWMTTQAPDGEAVPDRPPQPVPHLLEGRGRHQVAVQERRGRDLERVPGHRQGACATRA